ARGRVGGGGRGGGGGVPRWGHVASPGQRRSSAGVCRRNGFTRVAATGDRWGASGGARRRSPMVTRRVSESAPFERRRLPAQRVHTCGRDGRPGGGVGGGGGAGARGGLGARPSPPPSRAGAC